MNLKLISINIGKVLLINALFMLLSVGVSVFYGCDEGFTPLVISAIITLLVGFFPMIFVKKRTQMISLREGFVIIVLSWCLSFLFGMLPYILYGGEFSIINAWFESVSGYTTTGSTILTNVEALPKSILFWRSSTHYIGGLGVIVFLLLIMPDAAPLKHRLSNIEISSMSKDGYHFKSGKIVRVMLSVYVGMTIVETLLLWGAGMSLFDAVNHSFSTIATGGFSTRSRSLMYYDSVLINVIVMIFMTFAAMHFGVIFSVFEKRSLRPLLSDVSKYYLIVILILSVGVMLSLVLQGGYLWGKALEDSFFQVTSFISTTGFGNADNASWPIISNVILLFAAFHCGCSGSTTGGIKADRMLIALRAVKNEFSRRLHPSSFFHVRLDGITVRDEMIFAVFKYIVIYLVIFFISFCLVLASGVDIDVAFSGCLSSMGNVGPGIGTIGTMGNFASQPIFAKVVYTFDMFLGRLEIYPIFVALFMLFNRKKA